MGTHRRQSKMSNAKRPSMDNSGVMSSNKNLDTLHGDEVDITIASSKLNMTVNSQDNYKNVPEVVINPTPRREQLIIGLEDIEKAICKEKNCLTQGGRVHRH